MLNIYIDFWKLCSPNEFVIQRESRPTVCDRKLLWNPVMFSISVLSTGDVSSHYLRFLEVCLCLCLCVCVCVCLCVCLRCCAIVAMATVGDVMLARLFSRWSQSLQLCASDCERDIQNVCFWTEAGVQCKKKNTAAIQAASNPAHSNHLRDS